MRSLIPKYYLILIILFTILSFFQILFFDFIYWDDDKQILDNYYVKFLCLENIKHNFYYERFTFITLTFFSLIYFFFKNNPFFFHLASLIIHLLNIIIFYNLCRKINLNIKLSLLSTLLFAIHPLRIESIAWVSELKDLLFTFFMLLALIFYLNFLKENKFYYLLLYLIFALLSSYSKIQGLATPINAIIIEWFYSKKLSLSKFIINLLMILLIILSFQKEYIFLFSLLIIITHTLEKYFLINKNYIANILPQKITSFLHQKKSLKFLLFFFFTLFFSFIVIYILKNRIVWFWQYDFFSDFNKRIFYSLYSIHFYLKQYFFPIEQFPIYTYPLNFKEFLKNNLFIVILSLSLFFVSLIFLYKKQILNKRLILFSFGLFFINISFVLHLIPIEGRLLVAERYTYFSYIGLFFVTSSLIIKFLNKYWKFIFFLFGLIFSILINFRIKIWQNSEKFFTYIIKNNPEINFAWNNLGSYYLKIKNFEKSLEIFKKLEKQNKNDNDNNLYFNISLALAALGKQNEAIDYLNKAIKSSKNDYEKSIYYTTLSQLYEFSNVNLSEKYIDSALKSYPNNLKTKYLLAKNYLKKNLIDSAEIILNNILKINKHYTEAYNLLGFIELYYKKNLNEAFKYFNISVNLDNTNPINLNNRGYVYLLKKEYHLALKDFEKVIELDTSFYVAYKNRGTALLHLGYYHEALKDLSIYLKHDNQDLFCLTNRAYLYLKLKDTSKALSDLKLIYKLKKDESVLMEILNIFQKQKNIDSMYFYLKHFTIKNNKNPKLLFLKANLLLNLNELDSALFFLKYLKDDTLFKKECILLIAEIYKKSNNKDSACHYYKKFHKYFNNSKIRSFTSKYCE